MSVKTVAAKLQIKPDTTVWLSHPDRAGLIAPLPDSVDLVPDISAATVALVFGDNAESVRQTLDAERVRLAEPAIFWVAYPKGNRADINRDSLWPILNDYGMRPVSQVAIDDTWSALRFRPLREGEKPFSGGR